ncbi:MAG: mechanosensitive ion channel family protein [Elusimicrobia bacterium]|nr:mechanosensitive ion channel family protein [Candidatus Obscuribacterium magneticum]
MVREINILGTPIPLWLAVPGFYLLWLLVGLLIKRPLFSVLNYLAKKTTWKFDDLILESLHIPYVIMVLVWGFVLLIGVVIPQAEKGALTKYSLLALKIGTIVSIVAFIDQLLSKLIETYAVKVELLRISQSLVTGFVHILILVIGGLVILDSLGVSITPIIASLGIGSLAVALALQPTLENLFSGVQIILDKLIIPGQFVKLSSGEEGYVERVGWRSTWIRQLPNNMVVIPNKELVNTRVINYYYPSKDQAVLVDVGVHYSSDLKKVERVTADVAEGIMKTVPGAVPEFKPFIRFHTYSDSSINFTVILRAKEFVDGFLIKHEFIKALTERYVQERIIIPYPIVALNTEQEKAVLS